MSLVGKTLRGRYTITGLLGKGAMGSVYEARHASTERRLAVKVIHERLAGDEALVKRFLAEARAAGRISSQHVAQVVDVDTDPAAGTPFIVIEHLEGEDVEALVRRLGKLSEDLALRIAAQAALGLEKAHAAGIIHRDIKPANLFLTHGDGGQRVVKVVDFGVAKLLGDEPAGAALTRTGGIIGTPLYMSPEQARGVRDLDARTDVWSLGVVLYQMLLGAPPHAEIELVGDLLVAIFTRPAPPLRERAPWVSEEAARVVHKALQIDRENRYSTMAELRADLAALLPEGIAIMGELSAAIGGRAEAKAGSAEGERASLELANTAEAGAASATDGMSTAEFLNERSIKVEAGAAINLDAEATTERAPSVPAPLRTSTGASANTKAPSLTEPAAGAAPKTLWRAAGAGGGLLLVAGLLVASFRGRDREGKGADHSTVKNTNTTGLPSASAIPSPPAAPLPSGSAADTQASAAPEAVAPPSRSVRPCADPHRRVHDKGLACAAPGRAWCDEAGAAIACCGVGLVPDGPDGACSCAPGGTDDKAARRAGCPASLPTSEWTKEIRATLRPHIQTINSCYGEALKKLPSANGRISFFLELGVDGQVLEARVTNSTFPDAAAQACMLKVIRGVRFRPPPDGTNIITYPLLFTPGE